MKKLSEKSSVVLYMLCLMLLLQFSFSITCIQNEREALLQFKTSFHDPSHRLASWNGNDCCNWDGVSCNQTTGHVTKINLRCDINEVDFYQPLSSNFIDSSLLVFKYLNYLDLSGNDFNYTQIPIFLGSMVELSYLNLSWIHLAGKVPPHLGNLTKLDTLDLSFNWELQASDNVEWISHLSSLRFLWLTHMDFSKASNWMQLLNSLPLLSSLKLNNCNLQNINFSLSSLNYSSFVSRIQLLDLSNNQLSGPTPKAFLNMTSLKVLDLSDNKFTAIEGGLSSFIRNNCGLKVFDLSNNRDLGGDVFGSYDNEFMGCKGYDLQELSLEYTSMRTQIPIWLGKLKNLKSIDLEDSRIYGSIPASLGNLSSLELLDLSTNALTGRIPTSFGRLLNLRSLLLYGNRLEEVGDECFMQLGNLKLLDISSNLLKGVLTEVGFANLSQLDTLRIEYNEFLSLDMKSNWIPPFQLRYLDATSCIHCFGNEFPQWLQTQKALVKLLLSNTSLLISSLPKGFTPQNLTTLDLSHNKMVGPLFTTIVNQMPNLEVLLLHNNLINDSLAPTHCKLRMRLNTLDLSNNRLSGMVQDCFLTPKLVILDLSSNNFSGTFQYSHANLSNIQLLNLRNNNFEGSMPILLKNSKHLNMLDLEGNKFSGNIPIWLGNNLRNLKFLRLRDNLFNGTIPSSLCKLTALQILDLAHNQLEGNIPPNLSNFNVMARKRYDLVIFSCVASFDDFIITTCNEFQKNVLQFIKSNAFNYSMTQLITFMVNIDLSNNSLVGIIPTEVTMLKELTALNLSHNNLMGTIPAEIGEMESLESLDLSFNQLSGPIPRSLSKLNSLGALELSHNNFSGDIPREGHLSTFNEASSFDNNPYLCGDPLPKKCTMENPAKPPFKNIDDLDQGEDRLEKLLLYIMIILGYVVGFWAVVGTLVLKKSWRYTYFKFVEETNYKLRATIWRSIEMLKEIFIRK